MGFYPQALVFRYAFFFGRDRWVVAGALGVAYSPGRVRGSGYAGGHHLSCDTAGKSGCTAALT